MKTVLIGVVATMLSVSAAMAADLYQPAPEPIQAAPVEAAPAEVAGGWYLRGDVGYAFTKLRGAHFYQGPGRYVRDFDRADLDDSWTVGGGVGYQINQHLRTDVTLDYLGKADFSGSTSGSCGVSTNCTSRDVSSLTAWSLMANAYVDIGTYGAFTPYVGAGIGGTQVRWDKLKNTSCSTSNPDDCDDSFDHDGKRKWRFTYALMAGTSIDLTCNLQADVGYRFRHVLGGDMFGYKANGGPGSDKGLYLHEARAGLRYNFNGCAETAYVPDYPVEQPVYK
ncbi:outer membrane protein [Rhizobium sp. CC-YZS058]|uniref:outer membrane protein n=1 Tax=Rhizobium sp. CC-YZS058 TaxID=3042153 RepID=UPI002B057E79|nr:outer membrane protein [Rhizobium sp. CC-YZS058]MEA3533663.1 outer membrane protein [Rhizobium sp. CC-YZS058]